VILYPRVLHFCRCIRASSDYCACHEDCQHAGLQGQRLRPCFRECVRAIARPDAPPQNGCYRAGLAHRSRQCPGSIHHPEHRGRDLPLLHGCHRRLESHRHPAVWPRARIPVKHHCQRKQFNIIEPKTGEAATSWAFSTSSIIGLTTPATLQNYDPAATQQLFSLPAFT
ncbi:hypothetical protein B0H14DRAFT_3153441, partial [Mycena olivaceomarginata]